MTRDLAKEFAAVALVAIVLAAGWAAFVGQDANWDLRNYHFYAPYAWLSGTWRDHLAAAQVPGLPPTSTQIPRAESARASNRSSPPTKGRSDRCGLRLDSGDCIEFASRMDRFVSCRLERQ